ncbi:MAG: dienelactone hydrolase family protein [Acidobacteriota bacterium]|nr:dienelactone hydrolase family protein [Acidobacteriota bacterium]
MKIETLQFDTAGGATTAYVAMPNEVNAGTRGVVLIQEWWGLNDHIKDISGRYAAEGFIAVAPDLYRGKLATNPKEAGEMMQALKIEDGIDTIKNAVAKAREIYNLNKLGISGYCMGGTFSLRAACELEDFGAVAPFYGDIPPEGVLKNLKTPTLFIAGEKDAWINPQKVAELKRIALQYNLPVETVSYDADHAFFNDTRPEVYDAGASKDAWHRVLEHFRKNL